MEIEVVAIGNEILSGTVVNTNAAFIGKRLLQAGYKVARQSTLSDDPKILKEGLKEALGRSCIVIATGGLGPTCDDVTKLVASELFSSQLFLDEKVVEDLKKRFGNRQISLEQQATVPDKAEVLLNPVGTAPSFIFREDASTLILLPGVPQEMRAMVDAYLLPFLLEHFPLQEKMFQKRICFFLLSESEVDPFLREIQEEIPTVELGIYPEYGKLAISLTSTNQKALVMAEEKIIAQFRANYFESPSEKLEEAIHLLFLEKRKTLALAESVTGGLLSAQLTAFPGASSYLLGSFVVYSNSLKQKVLNVPESTLAQQGAVSEETARAMLKGVFETTEADYGIAVTGIAGPSGGTEKSPVGTVWCALGERGKPPFVEKFWIPGNREKIMLYSCRRLFANLFNFIHNR